MLHILQRNNTMSNLIEYQEVDRIEICTKFRVIDVRIATVIERDGKEISRSNLRTAFFPGKLQGGKYIKTKLTTLIADVRILAAIFWDDHLHEIYEKELRADADDKWKPAKPEIPAGFNIPPGFGMPAI